MVVWYEKFQHKSWVITVNKKTLIRENRNLVKPVSLMAGWSEKRILQTLGFNDIKGSGKDGNEVSSKDPPFRNSDIQSVWAKKSCLKKLGWTQKFRHVLQQGFHTITCMKIVQGFNVYILVDVHSAYF